ncbi:MAG: hypothetical protein N2323_01120 [candidate division WOR-3 bacterium]|nr:hypothetical protein [candidate division WOR-3 bacterium]
MRKIITLLILVFILVFVGSRLLRKKPVQEAVKKTQEIAEGTSRQAKRAGKRTGSLEKRERKSKEERRKERELRRLERQRLREERRRQRELQKLERERKRRSRKRRTVGMHILQAIVTVENTPYALIDGKQYKVGDEIMGRRIVKIESDRILLDYFGEITSVRVGEGCIPLASLKTKRRR